MLYGKKLRESFAWGIRRNLMPQSHHFGADGKVYYKIEEVRLEVYTDKKSLDIERRVESVLDKHGIFYIKSEVWIESDTWCCEY